LNSIPQTSGAVTATTTTGGTEATGNQTIVTGSAVFSFVRTNRVRAHFLLGGGVMVNDGGEFEAGFQVNYQFRVCGTYPINEGETVTIRIEERRQVPVVALGFGVAVRVAGSTGIRLDARVLASPNRTTTSIGATNSRITASPALALPSLSTPSLQFSNTPSERSSLSGAPVSGLVTYSGHSLDVRPQVTIGYFVRF
jgi:hypothetical protein